MKEGAWEGLRPGRVGRHQVRPGLETWILTQVLFKSGEGCIGACGSGIHHWRLSGGFQSLDSLLYLTPLSATQAVSSREGGNLPAPCIAAQSPRWCPLGSNGLAAEQERKHAFCARHEKAPESMKAVSVA